MTHFSVLVKIKPGENLADLLAPYQENGEETCPEEYLVFQPETGIEEKYQTGMSSVFVDLHGAAHDKYSDEFLSYEYVNSTSTSWTQPTFRLPENWQEKEIRHTELYPTMDEFASSHLGLTKDPKMDAYGSWENPNGKWGWYIEGGRWTGLLSGTNMQTSLWFKGHFLRHKFDATVRAGEFVTSYWLCMRDGCFPKKDHWYNRTRYRAVELGLVDIKCLHKLTEEDKENMVIPWTNRPDMADICKPIHATWAQENWQMFVMFSTAATLCSDRGWQQGGETGSFGTSRSTPESISQHKKSIPPWIYASNDDDFFVVVDCHT